MNGRVRTRLYIGGVQLLPCILNPTLRFSRLTYDDLHRSVPKDQGVGKWSDVQMPFSLSKPTDDPFSMVGLNSETKELISGILSDNS